MAYYQASLLVDHIVDVARPGRAAERCWWRTARDSKGTPRCPRGSACRWISCRPRSTRRSRRAFARMRLRRCARPKADPPSRRAKAASTRLKAAAAANPGSFSAQLALGAALAAAGDRAAFEPLERAAALVPMATGEDSPHAIMGALAEKLGDAPRAIRAYKRPARTRPRGRSSRRASSRSWPRRPATTAAAQLGHERVVALDPFDAAAHSGAGRLALKRKDAAIATREFKAALLDRRARQGGRALRSRRGLPARGQAGRREAGGAGRARDRADRSNGRRTCSCARSKASKRRTVT